MHLWHLAAVMLAASACATAPTTTSTAQTGAQAAERRPRSKPIIGVRSLMDVCWPRPAVPTERVRLNFSLEGGRLKDISFETMGASNATGRCLQQIAWEYPWETDRGGIPETMDLSPPASRPSGWYDLAYIQLLAESAYGTERGILQPAPLVRACMLTGAGLRPHIRFRVQTNPVRVSVFFELSELNRPHQLRTEAEAATSDSERCIKAVLGSTAYAGTRNFEFEFSDMAGAPPPAPDAEIASYFPPKYGPSAEVSGELEAAAVKEGLAARQPAVNACWDAALVRRSGLFGGRTFRLRIGAGGQLDYGHVISNQSEVREEADDYLLDKCVLEAIAPARFPPVRGGGAELAYSYVFELR